MSSPTIYLIEGERGRERVLLYFPFTIHQVRGDSETIRHHHSPERDGSLGRGSVEVEADKEEAGEAEDGSRCPRAGW